jgi:hypothetical protein
MKICFLTLLLAVSALFTLQARADDVDAVFQGTIGKYPIVMHLWGGEGTANATYFYTRFKQDINVRGDYDGASAHLSSDGTGEQFTLSRNGTGYRGTFKAKQGAALPVVLTPVAAGSVSDPRPDLGFTKTVDDYAKLRLTGITFVAGKKETVDGKYVIQWYSEPLTKLAMFRVVAGYSTDAMASMNRILEREHYMEVDAFLGCAGFDGGNGTDESSMASYFLNERWVSYSWSSSWTCEGAAHPDFGMTGTTIDARSGKEVSLEDILWLGSGAKPAERSDAWFAYRSKVFAPAVVALFKKLYPQNMKGGDGDDGCDYSNPDVWDFGVWYLTPKGLYLGAYFARVERSCDNPDWSVIPYGTLKKYNPSLFAN